MLQQQRQDLKRFFLQLDLHSQLAQFSRQEVDLKGPETQQPPRWCCSGHKKSDRRFRSLPCGDWCVKRAADLCHRRNSHRNSFVASHLDGKREMIEK
jgi:hypothetical protein